jgi:hypothetical protein
VKGVFQFIFFEVPSKLDGIKKILFEWWSSFISDPEYLLFFCNGLCASRGRIAGSMNAEFHEFFMHEN